MRQECQIATFEGPCGKPAVDYLDGRRIEGMEEIEDRFYFCAEHWNDFQFDKTVSIHSRRA